MGYKTKSMIYAKSLKASLNATSGEMAKGNERAEAIKRIGLGYTDVEPNPPESTNVEKTTPKPTPESLIKKAPEKKAEATKREKRKSDRKGVDSGVLSGLASGSKGTQTGTALGIMAKKIAGAVKGKKAKSATTATTTAAATTAAAAKTSAANKAEGSSETPAPMPAKTKADSFRFYEDPGMNKSTPKKATAKSGSRDLSKMPAGSPERIAEYKRRNWAMDATTGGAAKDKKKSPTGNAATENSLKNQKSIGKQGPSNVNRQGAVKGSGTAKDPIKPKNVKAKNVTKEGSVRKDGKIFYDNAWRTKSGARNRKFIQDAAKGTASAVGTFFEYAGPFGEKGWLAPGGKK